MSSSSFRHKPKGVLDQLGCVEMTKLRRPGTQIVAHALVTAHVVPPNRAIIGCGQRNGLVVTERFEALAFDPDQHLWRLNNRIQPRMVST